MNLKRLLFAFLPAVFCTFESVSQTLMVKQGDVSYAFAASQTGKMVYSNGTYVTIQDKLFTLSEVDEMTIDKNPVDDNTVSVSYNGTSASVVVAGNIAQYITAVVDGAHVQLTQSTDVGDATCGEITYTLSGTSSDGEFYLDGSYKATIKLSGLTLTNPSGPALNIQNGKRINIHLTEGTESTLRDGSGGDWKGALRSKGHTEFKGKGTLNVYGYTSHAIWSKEYVEMKNCTINILKSVGDGINVNQYFLMSSGTLNISGVGDDGIQVSYETDDDGTIVQEEENTGTFTLQEGTLTITTTAAAAKGVKAEGNILVEGGTVNVTTSGNGAYDSTEKDAKGSAGLSTDADMTISGGTLTLKNTGSGGKCIKVDKLLTINDGTITATNTGSKYSYSSSYTSSAKAIKAGTRTLKTGRTDQSHKKSNPAYTFEGGIVIAGGTVTASATSNEAIESKSTITISGGIVYASATDDAINSSSDFTITGGYVMGNSSGNDGLDANGDFYIEGGTVFAVATRSPEVGIDANTEGNFSLTITGGNIMAVGGLESGSTLSQTCYQASSYSKGSWYALSSNNTPVAIFKMPSNSSMGTPLVVSTSGTNTLKSGVTVSNGTSIWSGFGNINGTVSGGTTVGLSTYSNSGGGSGGGGGGPGGGGGGGRP